VVVLNVVRGLFPAFKGFSQALILDEVGTERLRLSHSLMYFNSCNH
jgi:hypothetical protein